MASITKRGDTFVVQFMNGRKRKTVTVGTSETVANNVCGKITDMMTARNWNRDFRPETVAWLEGLPDDMRERLERVGLIEPKQRAAVVTLGAFLADYFAKRTDVKPATKLVWGHVRRNLEAFFGKDKPLDAITPGDGKDFERYLRTTARRRGGEGKNLKETIPEGKSVTAKRPDPNSSVETLPQSNAKSVVEIVPPQMVDKKAEGLNADTIRKRIGFAKQFFNEAVDHKLLAENPFAKLKSGSRGNSSRHFFVTRDMMTKLMEKAPRNGNSCLPWHAMADCEHRRKRCRFAGVTWTS